MIINEKIAYDKIALNSEQQPMMQYPKITYDRTTKKINSNLW